jgi:hypothetical protein
MSLNISRFVTLLSIGMACAAYFIENKKTEQEDIKEDNASTSLSENSSAHVSTIQRLILHFSATRNLAWLYETANQPQSFSILFGLK